MNNTVKFLTGMIISFLISHSAMAGIVITGTRVIYPADQREVMVKIENNGKQPVLVQSWVDEGDVDSTPESAKAPFNVTPPINRVNPDKGQTLRLMFIGDGLPSNKESVFWLNVLEIPPVAKNNDNSLQMAFRSRIKIFYRPVGLPGDANEAGAAVTWKKTGGGLMATNPTPYHVSLAYISTDKEGRRVVAEGGMIPPGGTKVFATKGSVSNIYPAYINDYGAIKPILQKVS